MAELQDAVVDKSIQGKITFGKDGLMLPTPKWAINAFRWVLYIVAFIGFVCNIIPEIPVEIRNLINHYGIEAVALVHLIARFIGVKPQEYEIPQTN